MSVNLSIVEALGQKSPAHRGPLCQRTLGIQGSCGRGYGYVYAGYHTLKSRTELAIRLSVYVDIHAYTVYKHRYIYTVYPSY